MPGEYLFDQRQVFEDREFGQYHNEVPPVQVQEIEVTAKQFARVDVASLLLVDDELLTIVDQRRHDAADQFFPGGEVVIQRRFGDPQLVGDVLQAGALHTLLRE